MKLRLKTLFSIGVFVSLARLASAVTIMPTGAAAGEWSADWPAVRALAKANNTFYIINFGKTEGCNYCNAAEIGVFSKDAFKDWAKNNGIPLLYANRVSTTSEPGVSVKALFPWLTYYPHMLIMDSSGDGKTKIADFLYRLNREYNGIKVKLTPEDYIAIVESYTKPAVIDDPWDSTTKLPGDETWTNATVLAMGSTNRLHGAHTLKNADTNDWFAFTNLVAGQRYRIATTNVTVQNAVAQLSLYTNAAAASRGAAWTNLPLSAATTGLYFTASVTGTAYARASRGATNNANVAYSLVYRAADPTPHVLTVVNGTGSAPAALEGQMFAVAANADPANQFFVRWVVNPAGAPLGAGFNPAQRNGVVVMPTFDVTLTAQYEAETRILALSGSLAFGNVMTNRTSQKTLNVGNTGNRPLTVTSIDTPAGFSASPTSFTVAAGGSQAVTVTFAPTAIADYTGIVTVNAPDKTGGSDTVACSGSGVDNTPPQITASSPAGNPAMIVEGASATFGMTANDTVLDPDTATRGMVSITWLVDGVERQVTTAGAPNAITSNFTLRTDTNTVSGVVSNSLTVTAVALDRQGGRSERVWTLWVRNAAAAQTIAFPALPVLGVNDPEFPPGATASSGLPVEYTSSNESVAQIVDGRIRAVGAGSAVITARQPGNFDFNAAADKQQTLTVRARVSAVAEPVAGGTVTGAGLYNAGARVTLTPRPAAGYTFLRWEDGSQVARRSIIVGGAGLAATAHFKLTAEIEPPELANPGPQQAMVGVLFGLPLEVTSDSLPKVSVSGLPAGLRFDATAMAITGAPSVATAAKTVTITAKNVNPTTVTETFEITVAALPTWAWGAFNGWCLHGSLGEGTISLDVTSKGQISGKLSVAGTNYSFKAASYLRIDEDGALWLFAEAVAGKGRVPLMLKVYRTPPPAPQVGKTAEGFTPPDGLSMVEGWFGEGGEAPADIVMYRNVWKEEGLSAVIAEYVGYYTATLPVEAGVGTRALGDESVVEKLAAASDVPAGSAYLTLTVQSAGTVKVGGRLADGTNVSLSGALVLDDLGRLWTAVYSAPSTYKGGILFGLVEFVKPEDGPVFVRLLDGRAFKWRSLNPQATGDYGVGFDRTLGLTGGWYDKVGNLYDYYAGKTLSVGVGATDQKPVLFVGTNRYASVWWSPEGLAVKVVTNRYGVMTGLSAPTAGTPSYADGEWVYDGAENTVGLTLKLTRATGLFSGSFKAWYDYGTQHTYRSIAVLGALTPVRENPGDGVEGRGYFLSSDKSSYMNGGGRNVSYSFKQSYDFMIESAP